MSAPITTPGTHEGTVDAWDGQRGFGRVGGVFVHAKAFCGHLAQKRGAWASRDPKIAAGPLGKRVMVEVRRDNGRLVAIKALCAFCVSTRKK